MGNQSSLVEEAQKKGGDEFTIQGVELKKKEVASGVERLAADLPRLMSLSASYGKLKEVPEKISRLESLTALRLDHNRLSALPEQLAVCTRLALLDLAHNQLALFPAIKALRHVQQLSLAHNQLTAMPSLGGALTALTSLNLEGNALPLLPGALADLRGLASLNVAANRLGTGGGSGWADDGLLARLAGSLQELVLARNQLSALPAGLGALTRLTRLDASENQLAGVPASAALLTALRVLDLQHNALPALPLELAALSALQQLRLHDNRLSALPAGISALRQLQELYLQENELSALPAEVGQLASLRKLYCEYNKLEALPGELAQLKKLVVLIAHHNKLTDLPASLASMRQLLRLSLDDNPLPAPLLNIIRTQGALALISADGPPASGSGSGITGSSTNLSPANSPAVERERSTSPRHSADALAVPAGRPRSKSRGGADDDSDPAPAAGSPGISAPLDAEERRAAMMRSMNARSATTAKLSGASLHASVGPSQGGSLPVALGSSSAAGTVPAFGQFKDAWQNLLAQQDFSKKRKETLANLSDADKWALLNQYKGSTLALLSTQPGAKGAAGAAKTKSVQEYLTLLRGRPARSDLQQMAEVLDPRSQRHSSAFLSAFIENKGIEALLKVNEQYARKPTRSADDAALQLHALKCLAVLLQCAFRSFLTTADACNVLALNLLATDRDTVRVAVGMLADIADAAVGHALLLEALQALASLPHAGPRFWPVVRLLADEVLVPQPVAPTTPLRPGLAPPDISLQPPLSPPALLNSQQELKGKLLDVLNTVLSGMEELEARFALRNELMRLQLLEVLAALRAACSEPTVLDACERFEEDMSYDNEEMCERLESSIALRQQFVADALATSTGAAGTSGGNVLRALLLPPGSGAFVHASVPYDPTSDTPLAELVAAVRTKLLPSLGSGASPQALAEYSLFVPAASGSASGANAAAGTWLDEGKRPRDYQLQGEVRAELKRRPVPVRVVLHSDPARVLCDEPLSPLINVGALVNLCASRLGTGAGDEFGLFAAKPGAAASAPADGSGSSGEWLSDTARLSDYQELLRSGAELQLRQKLVPVRVLFGADEAAGSGTLLYLDKETRVRTLLEQLADKFSLPRDRILDYGLYLQAPTPTSASSSAADQSLESSSGSVSSLMASQRSGVSKWLKETRKLAHYGHVQNLCVKLLLKPRPVQVTLPDGTRLENFSLDLNAPAAAVLHKVVKKAKSASLPAARERDLELFYRPPAAASTPGRPESARAAQLRKLDLSAAAPLRELALPSQLDQLVVQWAPNVAPPPAAAPAPAVAVTPSAGTSSTSSSSTATADDETSASSGGGSAISVSLPHGSSSSALVEGRLWDEPAGEQYIKLEASGRIESATLNKLVEHLTNPADVGTSAHTELQNVFLMTYLSFCTPEQLWAKLMERYDVPERVPEADRVTIRFRVAVFITAWLKSKHEDVSEDLRRNVTLFAQKATDRIKTVLLNALNAPAHDVKGAAPIASSSSGSVIGGHAAPPSPHGSQVAGKVPKSLSETLSWFDLDDAEIARQLTMLAWLPFSRLRPAEFFRCAWSKPALAHLAPNLLRVIELFNSIGHRLATALLKQDSLRTRAKLMEKIINVTKHLREQHNFHLEMAIISGLSNSAVLRLKWTKEKLASKARKTLADLEAEVSMENSFKAYRAVLQTVATTSVSTPVIPYVGVYLQDLTFIEDGNPDLSAGRINMYKRFLVFNVISQIQRFQQIPYSFTVQPKIQKFLLDLPQLDNDELYKLSLAAEPRNAPRSSIQ